ncbi:hypothetical protein PR003_g11235 [Phytophthora rubi]|uniref:Uncharacterized protein n=1 Tax=Phytophthora rubi TaxID=129364 RepID=A0A6A4FD48_9STRA|nr:hypothetical protein PR002_g2428 [Phytophthora rubi]KAE9339014.1 hypothetical protein PR003_g11235 [Phytophthora rubi]
MERQGSPNPRPRRARRTRDEDDAPTHRSPAAEAQEAEAHAATSDEQPPQQGPPSQDQQAPSTDAMLAQMMQLMMQTQQQQQQQQYQQQLQFNTFMAQQAEFQRQVLTAQVQARMPHKKKGDPPTFNGKASEDLELWIFSTVQSEESRFISSRYWASEDLELWIFSTVQYCSVLNIHSSRSSDAQYREEMNRDSSD